MFSRKRLATDRCRESCFPFQLPPQPGARVARREGSRYPPSPFAPGHCPFDRVEREFGRCPDPGPLKSARRKYRIEQARVLRREKCWFGNELQHPRVDLIVHSRWPRTHSNELFNKECEVRLPARRKYRSRRSWRSRDHHPAQVEPTHIGVLDQPLDAMRNLNESAPPAFFSIEFGLKLATDLPPEVRRDVLLARCPPACLHVLDEPGAFGGGFARHPAVPNEHRGSSERQGPLAVDYAGEHPDPREEHVVVVIPNRLTPKFAKGIEGYRDSKTTSPQRLQLREFRPAEAIGIQHHPAAGSRRTSSLRSLALHVRVEQRERPLVAVTLGIVLRAHYEREEVRPTYPTKPNDAAIVSRPLVAPTAIRGPCFRA